MMGWASWLEGDVGSAYGEDDCRKCPVILQLVFARSQWSMVSRDRDKCIDLGIALKATKIRCQYSRRIVYIQDVPW